VSTTRDHISEGLQAASLRPAMDWARHETLSKEWSEVVVGYATAINAFVERGMRLGWDKAGDEPFDDRGEALAPGVVDVVREANAAGQWRALRERFPPAHAPLVPFLERQALEIHSITWIADDAVVATIGPQHEPTTTMRFGLDGETQVLIGVIAVGRVGDWFAIVREHDIELRHGWDAAPARRVSLPVGIEDIPERKGVTIDAPDRRWLESVQPLPDGSGALVVLHEGVFVSTESGVRRIYPEPSAIAEELEEAEDGRFTPYYDMIHAAVSPDGKHIACGSQDSQHLVFTLAGECISRFGPVHSSYPHHAAWSGDGKAACFNSCHFYNGATVGADFAKLRGLELEEYAESKKLHLIDDHMRVYASAWLGDAWALGDAGGYVKAVTPKGEHTWQHFIGSTVGGIALSPDGSKLAVGTAAGFLSFVELRGEQKDPSVIGTAGFRELLRYIVWKGEPIWRW
jgi:hypothetical protein